MRAKMPTPASGVNFDSIVQRFRWRGEAGQANMVPVLERYWTRAERKGEPGRFHSSFVFLPKSGPHGTETSVVRHCRAPQDVYETVMEPGRRPKVHRCTGALTH